MAGPAQLKKKSKNCIYIYISIRIYTRIIYIYVYQEERKMWRDQRESDNMKSQNNIYTYNIWYTYTHHICIYQESAKCGGTSASPQIS